MSEPSLVGWRKTNLDRAIDQFIVPMRDKPPAWTGDIPWCRIEDFDGKYLHGSKSHQYVDSTIVRLMNLKVFPPGTLLCSCSATLGICTITARPLVSNQTFIGLVPKREVSTEFLYYKMTSLAGVLQGMSSGTTIAYLPRAKLEALEIELPPRPEQDRIAEILSTVDEAIEQTEALIAKYQQIKAGLMHDLFTRGLSPEASAKGDVTWTLRPTRAQASHLYKESPLGWIPKEWEVRPLGVLAEIVSGVTLGSKSEISDGVGVPYLRVANVQDGYFDLTEVKTIRVSRLQFEKLQLKFGDVLMNEGGDFDKLGRGSVWQEEIKPCIHQNHVFRVRPRDSELRSHFLAFWSQSEMGKKYFVMSSKQSTNLASINSTQLNRFPVALPSSIEQETIEVRLMALNDHVDSLGQELAKLCQQKQGLMQDLLTGRVRVKVAEPVGGTV